MVGYVVLHSPLSPATRAAVAQIRQTFLERVTLLPNTKPIPKIIHSTIGCYTRRVPLRPLQQAAQALRIDLAEPIKAFKLVRVTRTRFQQHRVIKTYPL